MTTTAPAAQTLHRVPVSGKGPIKPLRFIGKRIFHPAFAEHQNRLVYTRWSDDIDIWRADGHTARRHPVSSIEEDLSPQLSPDGRRIAFSSNRSGAQEIWVANSDGTEPVQVTHFDAMCGSPRWSPDGRWITFHAYRRSGGWNIWAVESNGGQLRQLSSGTGSPSFPSFSHDGKWIYFADTRAGRSEVFRMPFTGGAAVQITHSGGTDPVESCDGKTVYYVTDNHNGRLYASPIAGGPERSLGLQVIGSAFEVMPDGIYFISPAGIYKNSSGIGLLDFRNWVRDAGADREIRFYDFATHRSRLIQALGHVNTFYRLAVSPDRKTFLYSVWQENGRNLMLVQNFH